MAYTLVGRHAPPELRARAVARTTVLGYGGYFLGPPILGLVAGLFGLRMAFVFAAVVLGLVPVLAPMVARIGAAQAAKAAA
jgi:MFS family permease